MPTEWAGHPAKPSVKFVHGACGIWNLSTDGSWSPPFSDRSAAERSSHSVNFEHLSAVSASLKGTGECKAWLIKPEMVPRLYEFPRRGPKYADELLHDVFDYPGFYSGQEQRDEANDVDKGVKFLQQFDICYDYLDEDAGDIRDDAWIVLLQDVHIENEQQCWDCGASLVRALIEEVARRAQLEQKLVLAFVRVEKSLPRTGRRSPGVPSERSEGVMWKDNNQAAFWERLGLERLNDGHLFPRDLDWLFWSPRARNASLLFECPRPLSPALGLYTLIEEDSDDVT